MLQNPSNRLLPARSGIAIVVSSRTLANPGGSPLGDTSHRPSAVDVAIRQNGDAASHSRSRSCRVERTLVADRRVRRAEQFPQFRLGGQLGHFGHVCHGSCSSGAGPATTDPSVTGARPAVPPRMRAGEASVTARVRARTGVRRRDTAAGATGAGVRRRSQAHPRAASGCSSAGRSAARGRVPVPAWAGAAREWIRLRPRTAGQRRARPPAAALLVPWPADPVVRGHRTATGRPVRLFCRRGAGRGFLVTVLFRCVLSSATCP